MQKILKKAKPEELEIIADAKTLKGDFLGVEVLNIPFTGPCLLLGHRADVTDRKLDVVCFEAKNAREPVKWLDEPDGVATSCRHPRRASEVKIT